MKKAVVIISCISVLGLSAAAPAYVLPGGFVIGKVAEQRNAIGMSQFTAEGIAAVATPGGEVSGEARLRVSTGCCVDLTVHAGRRDLSFSIADGKVAAASPEVGSLADALTGLERGLLAMFPGRTAAADLGAQVGTLGVDVETTSLARYFGRVAFVLGAGPRDRAAPQLWVDKDSYHALRMILARKGVKETVDIRFIDYQQSPSPGRFPRTIEIASGQTVLLRLEFDRISSGASASEDDDTKPAAPAKPKKQGR